MVLFKKSPVRPLEPPLSGHTHNDTEVWVMKDTNEGFHTYDEYLRKFDYYNQKAFTCEITGHSRLTYFDAISSERSGALAMETAFPQALREPLLRKVQFKQISRLDTLVNYLYDAFANDIQPKEIVQVEADNTGQRMTGQVLEKTSFAATSTKPAITRYFVTHEHGQTSLVDADHIFRPPRTFTKQLLRSYLRHNIEHENFENAPWTLKEHAAQLYGISSTLPKHLTQDAIQAWRKVKNALEKSKVELSRVIAKRTDNFEEMTRTIIEHKGKMPTDLVMRYAQAYKAVEDPSSIPAYTAPGAGPLRPAPKGSKVASSPEPSIPEVKYPCEDFEIQLREGASVKPRLHIHDIDEEAQADTSALTGASIGKALSIWSTLNIHSRFFVLDSFTYDDFVEALRYEGLDAPCELFEEIHCALLKSLVNKEGEPEAVMPALSDLSIGSDTSPGASMASTPQRRGSYTQELSRTDHHSGGSSPLSDIDQTRLTNGSTNHNAKALLEGSDWMTRIKNRNFDNGGWQVVVIGLLYHLSQVDWIDEAPEQILRELMPLNERPTQDTARRRYATLDINLRIAALECIIMLACTSRAFKESMETRALQQTTDRKDKTDAQRRRKPLIDELTKLDIEKKMNRPEDYDGPLTNGHAETDDMDIDGSEPDLRQDSDMSDADSEPMRGRRRSGRASDMKRKHAELEREKEEKLKEAAAMASTTERATYERLVAEYDAKRAEIRACEEEIAVVDGKLRENSCHRTRCLGVDRFCNRYWWFERNGMPFFGHEESSTAEHGYVNGRVWVQGPGALERAGFFEISSDDDARFRAVAGSTPLERRNVEQGDTVLENDSQWGYYETADELRALEAWLEDRGDRERKLAREMNKWRISIHETMEARHAYLKDLSERRQAADERSKEEGAESMRGVATRGAGLRSHRHGHSEADRLLNPCLAWTNGEAVRTLGHLHSEGQGRKVSLPRGIARPAAKGWMAANQMRETRRGTKY